MRTTSKCAAVAAVAAALTLAACSSGSNSSGSSGNSGNSGPKGTLTWWHNGNTQPLRGTWEQVANAFHAAHPKVSFNINPIQSNDFATKMPVALKSNNPPDIFQQWGGGNEATQVPSGKLANLGPYDSSWIGELGQAAKSWQVNGVQYGVPYDLHVVGFWYRKDLFKHGRASPPRPPRWPRSSPTTPSSRRTTWSRSRSAARTSGRTLSTGTTSPSGNAPQSTIEQAMKTVNLSNPCFTKAGERAHRLHEDQPVPVRVPVHAGPDGAGSSAGMLANGKVGHGTAGRLGDQRQVPALTSDKNIVSKLGWFPFPAVPGGPGDPTAVLDGGDGFSCTTGAPEPACADFLQYIDSTAVQEKLVEQANIGLPANSAAQAVLSNPALKTAAAALKNAPFAQVYFDIALPTTAGQALDTATANFFAGKASAAAVGSSVKASSGH